VQDTIVLHAVNEDSGMNWLTNAWVVGIGGGILSGLLVTWIWNLLLSKKKDREFQQQVATANREIIYAIRSGIPENSLPTRRVIEALIHSTARRYGLEPTDLYQPEELIEELIKEVMDSSFLSATKKAEYCCGLQEAVTEIESPSGINGLELGTVSLTAITQKRSVERATTLKASAFAGLLTGLATAVVVLEDLFPRIKEQLHILGRGFTFSLLIGILVPTVAIFWDKYMTQSQSRIVEADKGDKVS
jgi:hypothetical protein